MDVRSRSFRRHAGGALAVLGLVIAVDLVLAVLLTNPGAVGWTLPGFSSVGATVSVLSLGVWVLTYVLAPALIFTLGYRYGKAETVNVPEV